ncbi:hypothetical protein V1224_02680 [Lachnospiraceae bacterium JLR.KK008]
MKKIMTKAVATMAVVLTMAGCMSNVAFARHGHHSGAYTSGAAVQNASCYESGYCLENGYCDVDGVCQNGGICDGTGYHYREGHTGYHH